MKRWLVLAFVGLAVIWGPYVYSELASEPVSASGKTRTTLRFFGDDEPEPGAAEDLPAEPAAAAEEPAAEPEPEPAEKAAAAAREQPTDEPAAEQPAAAEADKPGEAAAEPAHPTLPSSLVPAFQKVFDAEPRDAFWANDEEGALRGSLIGAGAPPDTVAEVACRTTVCRAVFTPDEVESEALEKLYETLKTQHPDGVALDHKPEPVGQRGTLYVLRAGYQLEH